MVKPNANNLKLYREKPPQESRSPLDAIGSLPDVLQAFQRGTGWTLRYVAGPAPSQTVDLTWSTPANPGVGVSPGHLRLDRIGGRSVATPSGNAAVDQATARSLASAISGMVNELLETRSALWQREAELAAGVPLAAGSEQQCHLATRLQAVLKAGAEGVGCQAAGLYMLDEATTELKLRAVWGLPFDRLTAPPRPLEGSIADLEALLGHAVVLENRTLMQSWRVPEDFPAAVCIPVSSPASLLGTLWVFSETERDFNSRETNMLEVVAGRLAADLEREMLLSEGEQATGLKRQVAAAERLQRSQLPSAYLLPEHWQLAGALPQAGPTAGFYDWSRLPNGMLSLGVGQSLHTGLPGAMAANALKTALRAHAPYHPDPEQVLRQLNLTVWTGSAGDQHAEAFFGLLEPGTGRIAFSAAGEPAMWILRQDGSSEPLPCRSDLLGAGPEPLYEPFAYQLEPGESLLVLATKNLDRATPCDPRFALAEAVRSLPPTTWLTAEQIVDIASDQIASPPIGAGSEGWSLLAIKRSPLDD